MKTNNKLEFVDVIIPTAGGPHLKEAITSVMIQTYEAVSIILINDSGKSLLNIYEYFRDNYNYKLKIIDTDGRIGVGLSRNLGMSMSESPYIMFLDDDDQLPSNAISEAMTYIDKGYNGVFGATSYHDGRTGTITGYDCLFKDLDRLIILGAPCLGVLFNREDLKKLDLSFTNAKFGEEYLFTMCYFLMNSNAKYRITEKVLYEGYIYKHHFMDKTWEDRCSKMYNMYYNLYYELRVNGYLSIADQIAECVIGISVTDYYMNKLANKNKFAFNKLLVDSKSILKPWFGWARELFDTDILINDIPIIRQTPVRYQSLATEIHKVR